jgi:hypothetical protein
MEHRKKERKRGKNILKKEKKKDPIVSSNKMGSQYFERKKTL